MILNQRDRVLNKKIHKVGKMLNKNYVSLRKSWFWAYNFISFISGFVYRNSKRKLIKLNLINNKFLT